MMRNLVVTTLAAVLSAPFLGASSTKLGNQNLSEVEIQEIIDKFAAKEAQFALARENYTYTQTVRVQEVDPGGTARGRWEMVSDIIFSQEGRRTEKVNFAPPSTLRNILLTPEDMEDLKNVQPFVLTSRDIDLYHVRYLGKQMADEIPCFVFAVKPKKLEKGKRYFAGMIWVDDRDLQIVKTYGRGVGITKDNQQFPKFETLRLQIDGKYWFPVYTTADDTLHFDSGAQRIRMLVKYENYKQFGSDVQIRFGEVIEGEKPSGEKPSGEKPDPKPSAEKP
jgi:hypothetical protein